MSLEILPSALDAIALLDEHLKRRKNLTALYSQAGRQVSLRDCRKLKITHAAASRAIVHDSYKVLRKKILKGELYNLSEESILKLFRSIIGTKAKHYSKPNSNRQKVSLGSSEFTIDLHDKEQVFAQVHSEEQCYEAFAYLKQHLRLDEVDEFLLKGMLEGEKYDKVHLAKVLQLSAAKVQGKRDYLRRRIDTLNKVEPLYKRLSRQHI